MTPACASLDHTSDPYVQLHIHPLHLEVSPTSQAQHDPNGTFDPLTSALAFPISVNGNFTPPAVYAQILYVVSLMPCSQSTKKFDLFSLQNISRIQPLLTNPPAITLVKAT